MKVKYLGKTHELVSLKISHHIYTAIIKYKSAEPFEVVFEDYEWAEATGISPDSLPTTNGGVLR